MRIATHNVWVTLDDGDGGGAERALRLVLRHAPRLIGLQEWSRKRRAILADHGVVVVFPRLRRALGRRAPEAGMVWVYPLGGQPVGYDAGRYALVAVRRLRLARRRKSVRTTWGTEVILIDRRTGEVVAVLNTHLIAHHDREQNRAAFEEGWASLEAWVDSWTGYERYVLGDMNSQRLRLGPLVSCWHGHDGGSFRGRPIDHVYADEPADDVTTIPTPSDHDAVVADYEGR